MAGLRTVEVEGVSFQLAPNADGTFRVLRNGREVGAGLEEDGGKFRVVSLAAGPFALEEAIRHLAYWYTMPKYKEAFRVGKIEWPDGTTSKVVSAHVDEPLQLMLWQIEVKIETARRMARGLFETSPKDSGKDKVYRAEVGLHVHRAIELMLKIPLRFASGEWAEQSVGRGHWLSILHDRVEALDGCITGQLDEAFQTTVMVHGDPRFGNFRGPIELRTRGQRNLKITLSRGESTVPAARHLRDHLALFDTFSTYRQSYLGDAVHSISDAYLRYISDVEPLLSFVEKSLEQVILPWVRQRA